MQWLKPKTDDNKWREMNQEVLRLTTERKMDEALRSAGELFEYTKRSYGKKHKNTVIALNNLGIINMAREDFDEAESYLLSALEVSEKVSGRLSKEVSMINMNLAKLYAAKSNKISVLDEVFVRDSF
jgi:hypothetical protein